MVPGMSKELALLAVKAGISKRVDELEIPEDRKRQIYERLGLPCNC
jgi:hypothetical protein